MVARIGVIDPRHGDREHAVLEPRDPAFFSQIPDVKLKMFGRTVHQAFKIKIADAGIGDVLPAFDVEERQQLVLHVGVAFDDRAVAFVVSQFPAVLNCFR